MSCCIVSYILQFMSFKCCLILIVLSFALLYVKMIYIVAVLVGICITLFWRTKCCKRNIVESIAFNPPNRPQLHQQMKIQNKRNLQFLRNSLNNKIAVLWYNLDAQYTILYSHGNSEDIAGSRKIFSQISNKLNCNLCAYDYSGYGLSDGICCEKAAYCDIECVFKFLTEEHNINRKNIILFGRSLGSGPSVHLGALILQSPLRTAMKTQLPDWLCYLFKNIDIFKNEDKLINITNYPILIIHGTNDYVVPYSHGKYLYNSLKKDNINKDNVVMYSVNGRG
eukprot:512280_1